MLSAHSHSDCLIYSLCLKLGSTLPPHFKGESILKVNTLEQIIIWSPVHNINSLLHAGSGVTSVPLEQTTNDGGYEEKPSLHTICRLPGRRCVYNLLAVALIPGVLVIFSVSHLSAKQVW